MYVKSVSDNRVPYLHCLTPLLGEHTHHCSDSMLFSCLPVYYLSSLLEAVSSGKQQFLCLVHSYTNTQNIALHRVIV